MARLQILGLPPSQLFRGTSPMMTPRQQTERAARMKEWLGDMAELVGFVRFDGLETAPILLLGRSAWLVGCQLKGHHAPANDAHN